MIPPLAASCGLRVLGDDLDPGAVTAILGVTPTLAYRKGEEYVPRRGAKRTQVGRSGVWLYSPERGRDPVDALVQLQGVAQALAGDYSPHPDYGRAFSAHLLDRGLTLDVNVFWYGGIGSDDPLVNPEYAAAIDTLTRLTHNFGGHIDCDFDADDAGAIGWGEGLTPALGPRQFDISVRKDEAGEYLWTTRGTPPTPVLSDRVTAWCHNTISGVTLSCVGDRKISPVIGTARDHTRTYVAKSIIATFDTDADYIAFKLRWK